MKATTLKNRIAKSNNKNGSIPNNPNYRSAIEVIETGFARVGYYTGSGRWTKAANCYPQKYLRAWGIDFETGNDAPRGGVTGDFVRLTKKGDKQVKSYVEELWREREEARKVAEAAKVKREAELREIQAKAYAEISCTKLFELWTNKELKDLSGKSWRDYRDDLIAKFPFEWAELKAKFKSCGYASLNQIKN